MSNPALSSPVERWVLAFDASCGTCRQLSGAVAQASGGKLEVLPLHHPDVRKWRAHSASGSRWTPALIKVTGARAITWTGPAMVIRLLRRLGLPRSLRALAAVGRFRRQQQRAPRHTGVAFVQLLTGLAVVGSLLMAKTSGPGAEDESARAWVEANRDRLPRGYDDLTPHSLPYRRAIVSALDPDARTQLWVEHLNRYRAAHPELAEHQLGILDRAAGLVSRLPESEHPPLEELQSLETAAIDAFGRDTAHALLTTLGAPSASPLSAAATPDCDCSNYSDWCGSGTGCTNYPRPCVESSSGCGTFWTWDCDGICQPPLR